MSAQNYTRPASAERYAFRGMKTNAAADAIPAGKSPYAQNIRAYKDDSVTSRPQVGLSQSTTGSPGPVLALDANLGVYKIGSAIYYSGAMIDGGYSPNLPCSLVPFRPNQSPVAWEYVFDGAQSRKVLPSPLTVENAGIAEPQLPPQPVIIPVNTGAFDGLNFIDPSQTWGNSGTAGAVTNNNGPIDWRTYDVIFSVWPDPASGGYPYTIEVNGGQVYSKEQLLSTPGAGGRIVDVFTPIPNGITVAAIYYFSGTTGMCIVVPDLQSSTAGVGEQSLQTGQVIAGLRRGALVSIGGPVGSGEICYVYDVEEGPDGTICFTTSTTTSFSAGTTINGVPAIQLGLSAPTAGNPLHSSSWTFSVGSGIGTIQIPAPTYTPNFFSFGGASFQPDDYVHLSILCSDLANLNEVKLLFNVAQTDTTFTQDAYYYAIRPSDIQQAVSNQTTQLGAFQVAAQRALITQEQEAGNGPGNQTTPGDNQWAEICIPLRDFVRIGNDQTVTLNNTNGVQIMVNANANIATMGISSITVHGGGQVDVGADPGTPPIYYCYRLRSTATGARSNRSPASRYGVNPRREGVNVFVNLSGIDSQADVVDHFRMGSTIEDWRYVGTQKISSSPYLFFDDLADDTIRDNDSLEDDNYQPWPTIDVPFTATGCTVTGYAVVVPLSSPGNVLRLLPGNLIQIGNNVYTLYTRPTSLGGGNYLFLLVENAGALSSGSSPYPERLTGIYGLSGSFSVAPNAVSALSPVWGLSGMWSTTSPAPSGGQTIQIYEPQLAAQPRPYVWGPDARGVLFGVGDPLRPGAVSRTKPNNPDSASEKVDDLCPPTEPLQGGELLAGTSFAASAKRWWRGYPQDNPVRPYNWVECPVGDGLAAPFAHCTDGKWIYFLGKDGIKKHEGGPATSLTDDDLYNLFPHEGTFPPQSIVYAGQTLFPPDFTYAANFQLSVVNGYLYFDYLDSNQIWRTLTMDTRSNAWIVDSYDPIMSLHAGSTQPLSNDEAPSGGAENSVLYLGSIAGDIYTQLATPNSGGETVGCVIATHEEVAGDLRSQKLWGDIALDASSAGTGVTVNANPTSLSALLGTPTVFSALTNLRPQQPYLVSLGGEILARSLGLMISWADQGLTTVFYSWQPSYIPQPEWSTTRIGDWDDGGVAGLKFWQGFLLEADTANAAKTLIIRDSDTLGTHEFNSALGLNVVQHNGQSMLAYTFTTPFLAHMIRFESAPIEGVYEGIYGLASIFEATPLVADQTPWRVWSWHWVAEPAPEFVLQWITQPTGHGIDGYKYVPRLFLPYNAPAPMLLRIVVDGSPLPDITVPASNGYRKIVVPLPPNKGLLYTYQFYPSAPSQIWQDDIEVMVGQWGRSGQFARLKNIGGEQGDAARI